MNRFALSIALALIPSAAVTRRIMYTCTLAALAALMFATAPSALCIARRDMNGEWKADDRGTYYVRQIGNAVWWVGMSPDEGRTWMNVFKGVRMAPV
jgi:hypothetical protein